MLQGPERAEDRVEKEQEDQGAIMVEMELAIAGSVALTADVMEPIEEWQYLVEVLEPLKLTSRERAVGWLRHEISPPRWQSLCLAEQIAQILCRTDVETFSFLAESWAIWAKYHASQPTQNSGTNKIAPCLPRRHRRTEVVA